MIGTLWLCMHEFGVHVSATQLQKDLCSQIQSLNQCLPILSSTYAFAILRRALNVHDVSPSPRRWFPSVDCEYSRYNTLLIDSISFNSSMLSVSEIYGWCGSAVSLTSCLVYLSPLAEFPGPRLAGMLMTRSIISTTTLRISNCQHDRGSRNMVPRLLRRLVAQPIFSNTR